MIFVLHFQKTFYAKLINICEQNCGTNILASDMDSNCTFLNRIILEAKLRLHFNGAFCIFANISTLSLQSLSHRAWNLSLKVPVPFYAKSPLTPPEVSKIPYSEA